MNSIARRNTVKIFPILSLLILLNMCMVPAGKTKRGTEKVLVTVVSPTQEKIPNSAEPEPMQKMPPPAKKEVPTPLVHVVRWEGETLTLISLWYTGSANNWKAVAKLNPGLDPRHIFIGQEILIPQELLNKQEKMPRRFIPASDTHGKTPPPSRKAPSPSEKKEMDLFGPVGID